eukprot:s5_g8.t1
MRPHRPWTLRRWQNVVLVILAGRSAFLAAQPRRAVSSLPRRAEGTNAEGKDEKRGYQFGDLFINKLTGKDKYEFGDLSRFVGGKLQEADVYELGDLSKYLDTQAKKQVSKLTGKDSYEFGDISREIARRVQESDVVDEEDLRLLLTTVLLLNLYTTSVEVELGNRAASKLTGAELDRRAKGVLLGKGNEDYVLGDLTKAQIQRSVASLTGKESMNGAATLEVMRLLIPTDNRTAGQQLTARSHRDSLHSARGSDLASQRDDSLGSEPSRPTTPAPPPVPVASREPAVPPLPPLAQAWSLGPLTPPLPPPPAEVAGEDPAGPLRPPAAPEPDHEAVPESPGPFEASRPGLALPLKPVPVLPTPAEVWRAPNTLGTEGPAPASPDPLLPAPELKRSHDAIPRHLQPHAWGVAAKGSEAMVQPEKTEGGAEQAPPVPGAAITQAPIGAGLAPASYGGAFGGARGSLALGMEAQLVDRLAERFLEQREAPTPDAQNLSVSTGRCTGLMQIGLADWEMHKR